jgi:hypothetical protein
MEPVLAAALSLLAPQLSFNNSPPIIQGELPPRAHWHLLAELRFTLTITDPDGDPVELRTASILPGLEFLPVVGARPPVTREVRWRMPWDIHGPHEIAFEAFNTSDPTRRTRWSRTIVSGEMVGWNAETTVFGDVTGDGSLSVICAASRANHHAARDAGAVYVWNVEALSPPPNRTPLSKPSGSSPGSGVFPIAPRDDRRAVARLMRSTPMKYDSFGDSQSVQAIRLLDVNADGVRDVVVTAPSASFPTAANVGTVSVFLGGSELRGQPPPWVEFTDPNAAPNDSLGHRMLQAVLFEDVSGDGYSDLVVNAVRATVGGVRFAGRIYVFQGGPAANASAGPLARLEMVTPDAYDGFGSGGFMPGIQVVDVTGDGQKDVVATAYSVDVNGSKNSGGVFIWHGGPALVGTRHPDAGLSTSADDDHLCLGVTPLFLQDVSGDGVVDIVAVGPYVNVSGILDAGAIAIWFGGKPFTGTPPPDALLANPAPHGKDYLGVAGWSGAGVELRDLTGDRIADIVALATYADEGGIVDSGAVFVWEGGANLVGTPAPLATLTGLGATQGERLGVSVDTNPLQFADVTGDGHIDLVVPAPFASEAGVSEAGVIHVFAGGPAMKGAVQSVARLRAGSPQKWDHLGFALPGVLCVDVTGDGIDDVVASAYELSRTSTQQGGGFVWTGGPGLAGATIATAELLDPFPANYDHVGLHLSVADVDDDGIRDVLLSSEWDRFGTSSGGSVQVFRGGPTMTGTPAPAAFLAAPAALGPTGLRFQAEGFYASQLVDLNLDGRLDVVGAVPDATVSGSYGAGAVLVWFGGSGVSGQPLPDLVLTDQGDPATGDRFGSGSLDRRCMHVLPRWDRAGPVIFVTVPFDSVGEATKCGSIHVFDLHATRPSNYELYVPGARDDDTLGIY